MKEKRILSMNLQFFAEPPQGGDGATPPVGENGFDYDKLANIISGKQAVAEESTLKGFFKQQGLSPEEMNQAIASFKEQKASKTPDVAALQQQATQAQTMARQATIEKEATFAALELGISPKTVPYLLRLADFGQSIGADGKTDGVALKKALEAVLADIPQLKPEDGAQTGFRQVGASGGKQQTGDTEALARIFGV